MLDAYSYSLIAEETRYSLTLTHAGTLACGHHGDREGTPDAYDTWGAIRRYAQAKADASGTNVEVFASAKGCQNWVVYVAEVEADDFLFAWDEGFYAL